MRQQVGLVGDEHAPDMQPDMGVAIALDHVEGLHAGDEQQAEIFQHAFGPPVQRSPGLVEEMTEVTIEFLQVLLGHVGL